MNRPAPSRPAKLLPSKSERLPRGKRRLLRGPRLDAEEVKFAINHSLRPNEFNMSAQSEVRSRALGFVGRTVADHLPLRRVLLDHVSKTGGSTVIAALGYLFPFQTVLKRFDLATRSCSPEAIAGSARWPIVCGHVGHARHALIPDIDQRVLCTIVRDPVSRARSVYTFFRYNVRPVNPRYDDPALVAARELDFTDFIRHEAVIPRISNAQSLTLSPTGALPSEELAADSARLLEPFDVVGVTNRLECFLTDLLRVIEVGVPMRVSDLIEHTYDRRSKQSVAMCEADAAYLREINRRDLQLHAAAVVRSDEGPRVSSATRSE